LIRIRRTGGASSVIIYYQGSQAKDNDRMASTHAPQPTPQIVALVDDETQILQALKTLLSFKGMACSVHESAESLLAAVHLEHDKLWLMTDEGHRAMVRSVVLDMNLPGMNGADLVGALRHMQQDLQIVMMTAALEDQLKERSQDLKGVTLLSKPFSIESIERALQIR